MPLPEFIQKKAEEFRAEAKRLRDQAKENESEAEALERHADNLTRDQTSQSPESPRISDWRGVDRATALHEYMRQFHIGKRVQISDVVKALRAGGCADLAGKQRPGKTNPQMEAERNLLITAGRSRGMLSYDRQTREIWRN